MCYRLPQKSHRYFKFCIKVVQNSCYLILWERGYTNGFVTVKISPIFPWFWGDMVYICTHVETVVLLQKSNRKPDAEVKISLELEEYHRIMEKDEWK